MGLEININKKIETTIPLEMYEISGQGKITEHSLNRYLKNKKQDEAIEEQLKKSISYVLKRKIEEAKYEELPELIREAFQDPDLGTQRMAAAYLRFVPEEQERISLIKAGLENPVLQILVAVADNVKTLSEKEQISLIKYGLEHPNIVVSDVMAGVINFIPKKEQEDLRAMVSNRIEEGFKSKDLRQEKMAIWMARSASLKDRAGLIRKGLVHANPEVQAIAPEEIEYAPEIEQVDLLEEALNHSNVDVRWVAAKNIDFAPIESREYLSRVVLSKIEKGLESKNPRDQVMSSGMINFLPLEDQAPLRATVSSIMKKELESSDLETQKHIIHMIWSVGEKELPAISKIIKEKKLSNYLVQSNLYEQSDLSNEKFKRKQFEKSGSGTMLLGGPLKDNTIIREVTPESFIAWQKLYENNKLWQKNGFDYVPIEPIRSYKLNEKGFINVSSGVLDCNLFQYGFLTKKFEAELEDQKNKILNILANEHLDHGHPHGGNFCLRFFRDENGEVDFDRMPRLYLIDFDQVVIF